MKISININQERIVSMGLKIDLTDAALFDYCNNFFISNKSQKVSVSEKSYTLIDPARVLVDMPILGVSTAKSVNNHIDRLVDAELLERCPDNRSLKGTYVCAGPRYDEYVGFEEVLDCVERQNRQEKKEAAPKKKPYEFSGLELPHKEPRFIALLDSICQCKDWKNKSEAAWKMTFNRLAKVSEPVASTALAISIDRNYRGIFPESVKPEDIKRYLGAKVTNTSLNTTTTGLSKKIEDFM